MDKTFVFANDAASVAELTAGASGFGGEIALITCGTERGCADTVYTYSAELSVVSVVSAIAELVHQQAAKLVLCEASRDGRLIAGYCAAKLGTSPLCDVSGLASENERMVTTRLVYGGTAVKTESSAFPAVAIVGASVFEPSELSAVGDAISIDGSPVPGAELVEFSCLEAKKLNLAAAKKVIGVGRGLSSADNLPLIQTLADLMGAEIGCTRPVAEEEHWYTKDRYIGVSGVMLKPSVYLAVGISGQIQHMVGVNRSGVIFSIDRNENAPIVSASDYCLVGDVNTILPALIEKLS